MADEEAQASFVELQKKYNASSSELKSVAMAGRAREQERQRLLLTLSELDPLPDGATLYRGLGRACVPPSQRSSGGGPAATAAAPHPALSRLVQLRAG